jgi:hypothetical protein
VNLCSIVECTCCCQPLLIDLDETRDIVSVGRGCTSVTLRGLLFRQKEPINIRAQTPVAHFRKDIERVPQFPFPVALVEPAGGGNGAMPPKRRRKKTTPCHGDVLIELLAGLEA